ncbi:hypothetical protein H7171_01505 [Candidatus Saccharibacteria bacterium]|nr:hypothetical protein [Candidatus Saccharibacteria bacterium]
MNGEYKRNHLELVFSQTLPTQPSFVSMFKLYSVGETVELEPAAKIINPPEFELYNLPRAIQKSISKVLEVSDRSTRSVFLEALRVGLTPVERNFLGDDG